MSIYIAPAHRRRKTSNALIVILCRVLKR